MNYTPGYSVNATTFMARRTLDSHAAFLKPLLRPNLDILDVGCGPGSISCDLARQVPEGSLTGLDLHEGQIAKARESARAMGIENARFLCAEGPVHDLPSDTWDLIFCHAVLEHQVEPMALLFKLSKALHPNGFLALRSPDWGGWVLHPETPEIRAALGCYERMQQGSGGDPHAGRKLGNWLRQVDALDSIQISASYEIYQPTSVITEYLAQQLEREGHHEHASNFRNWGMQPDSLFAQSWFEAIGQRRE